MKAHVDINKCVKDLSDIKIKYIIVPQVLEMSQQNELVICF